MNWRRGSRRPIERRLKRVVVFGSSQATSGTDVVPADCPRCRCSKSSCLPVFSSERYHRPARDFHPPGDRLTTRGAKAMRSPRIRGRTSCRKPKSSVQQSASDQLCREPDSRRVDSLPVINTLMTRVRANKIPQQENFEAGSRSYNVQSETINTLHGMLSKTVRELEHIRNSLANHADLPKQKAMPTKDQFKF